MSEWFRNTTWNDAIEADFNARLARSRGQRAQYLRIQGSVLKDSHPEAALDLLRRCIEAGDEFHIAAALLDTAHAHYRLGDVEQALVSLEAAMERGALQPMFRTSAPFDYVMLVALHRRTERYDRALAILEQPNLPLFPVMVFQREAALAVIHSDRGEVEQAKAAAERALAAEAVREGWVPGHPSVGVVPDGDNVLSARMREISNSGVG